MSSVERARSLYQFCTDQLVDWTTTTTMCDADGDTRTEESQAIYSIHDELCTIETISIETQCTLSILLQSKCDLSHRDSRLSAVHRVSRSLSLAASFGCSWQEIRVVFDESPCVSFHLLLHDAIVNKTLTRDTPCYCRWTHVTGSF